MIGDGQLIQAHQVVEDHRQRRFHPVEQRTRLLECPGSVVDDAAKSTVLVAQLAGHVRNVGCPALDRVGRVGLGVQDRLALIDQRGHRVEVDPGVGGQLRCAVDDA